MPPTFLYFFGLAIWIFCGCLVWVAAGLMSLTKQTRIFSRPLCFAMAGTFPFVFVYQMIAAPFAAAVLVAAWAFWKAVDPGASSETQNPFVIATFIVATFLSLGTMLAMSLAGFYEGWRTGWALSKGQPFQEALLDGPTVKLLARLIPNALLKRIHIPLSSSHQG